MFKSNIFYLLISSFLFYVYCQNDICLVENNKNCEISQENKYLRDNNSKYLDKIKLIENAFQSYESCEFKNCSCYLSVLTNDLKKFKKDGITEEVIDKIHSKGTKYQIINNRLYRDKSCMFPSRCSGIEHFLLKLLRKLPDMELIINTRDLPQSSIYYEPRGPVFSFSKNYDYLDIMYPSWSFWEGGPAISLYPQGLGRWDKHRKSVTKVGDDIPWEKKEEKAFFRGSRTSWERDNLVLLSRDHPELVDAQYTKNQAWKSDADTLHAAPAKEISLEEHCKYKYLFNFRGVAASFRFKHLFLCKSLVFHVGNEWMEFFYPILKPWIHYIPVDTKATKEDIKELIEFAKNNDEVVKNIALRGFQIIWDLLEMEDVLCYWNKLLRKYAKLLKYKPKRDATLIEIK